jgi:hypothetical protein
MLYLLGLEIEMELNGAFFGTFLTFFGADVVAL